ncbi:MAG: hypothetical protein KJN60_11330 [Boseongicola sp.]|nr:hypothetical protein [Boseongicola sp.]
MEYARKTRELGKQEREASLMALESNTRKGFVFGRYHYKAGRAVAWNGRRWLILDADADASTPTGCTLHLLSEDGWTLVSGFDPNREQCRWDKYSKGDVLSAPSRVGAPAPAFGWLLTKEKRP